MRGAVLGVFLLAAACAQDPGPPAYSKYCALCHGQNGEGYAADSANALANREFLASASDAFLRSAIQNGRPGTAMSAWGKARGGPLTDEEVDAIVRLIRSWQTLPNVDVSVTATGVALRAQPTYDAECKKCHGDKGAGATFMTLNSADMHANATDGYLRYAIDTGRTGTPMVAFGSSLTPQTIDDLVVLLRTFRLTDNPGPSETPVLDPAKVVMNPGGPEPVFPPTHYVPVDVIKAEMDKGASFGLLDARAPSDYVLMHIAGAVSVPFYAADSAMPSLPKDKWLVAYCGCPHAASDELSKVLDAAGYRTKVIDEGYFVWQSRGYPVRAGVNP